MIDHHKLQELLASRLAKLEPFNEAYAKLYMRRPPVNTEAMAGLNKVFAEGGPEFNAPVLVDMAEVRKALTGAFKPDMGRMLQLAAAIGRAKTNGDVAGLYAAQQEHDEYRSLLLLAEQIAFGYTRVELDEPRDIAPKT